MRRIAREGNHFDQRSRATATTPNRAPMSTNYFIRKKRELGHFRRRLGVLMRLARQGRNPAQFPKYLPDFPEADK